METNEPRAGRRPPPWTRILIGCALAFGAVLLVGFALAIYGVYWAVSPGRQVPTMAVVGPDSVGVVRLDRASTDAGMQDLLQEVMTAIQRAQLAAEQGKVPPFIEGLKRWQLAQPSGGYGMWLPAEATLSLEPRGEDDEPRWVVAVNFRHFVRPVRTMIEQSVGSDPKTRVIVHRENRILAPRSGPAVCFTGGTLLVADRAERLTALLDRVDAAGEASPPPPPALRDLTGRWDVVGALDRPEEARSFAAPLLGEDVPDALTRIRFGLDVETADAVRGRADFELDSEDAALRAQPAFAAALAEWERRAREEAGLDLSFEQSLEGGRLRVDAAVAGLRAGIARWAARAMREKEREDRDRRSR
jgi:hypothetical protein